LRRIGVVPVKVWLLGRRRLAQGFLSHLCIRARARIQSAKMKIAAGGNLGFLFGVYIAAGPNFKQRGDSCATERTGELILFEAQ
jgi:hypothetical protein